ncbi:Predicted methyltransferase [Halopseudomonas xinjiangensis]|uniref:Predicted methyltransferase n=1 Tax=Halopseudomonas xinjiangensis TaxID=487184 RepID=A0A1H1NHM1_9GAMM|nr:class I SAM-dependent methyltransferase [Halopseudomonas xinjiangensis]SDR98464.1 Predicted methyltransferase [Halopseudomonas xinjiangensis]
MRPIILAAMLLLPTVGLAQQPTVPTPQMDPEHQQALRQAIGSPTRSITNVVRDAYRNPEHTLAFFRVEPQHTVVEAWPGGGWYTEILAPYLEEEGKLIAAHFDPESTADYQRQSLESFEKKLDDPRGNYEHVEVTVLNYDPDTPIAEPGSADRVLTFRNVHNWLAAGMDESRLVFSKFHAALKPGGMLGVVEHQAQPGTELEQMIESGYVTQQLVTELAEEAGFELVGSTPVNQNPQDTKDHPEGVWTLPPTLKLGDENRTSYLAIGESDRMTLLFRKK